MHDFEKLKREVSLNYDIYPAFCTLFDTDRFLLVSIADINSRILSNAMRAYDSTGLLWAKSVTGMQKDLHNGVQLDGTHIVLICIDYYDDTWIYVDVVDRDTGNYVSGHKYQRLFVGGGHHGSTFGLVRRTSGRFWVIRAAGSYVWRDDITDIGTITINEEIYNGAGEWSDGGYYGDANRYMVGLKVGDNLIFLHYQYGTTANPNRRRLVWGYWPMAGGAFSGFSEIWNRDTAYNNKFFWPRDVFAVDLLGALVFNMRPSWGVDYASYKLTTGAVTQLSTAYCVIAAAPNDGGEPRAWVVPANEYTNGKVYTGKGWKYKLMNLVTGVVANQ